MSIPTEELNAIILFLACHGVLATSRYFKRHRITIRNICKKYGIIPQKDKTGRKTNELTMKQLKEKWQIQDTCIHKWYTIRCSECGKILGSETKV